MSFSVEADGVEIEPTPPAKALDAELALKVSRDQHQFEYAMAALASQERDREKDREHGRFCMGRSIWLLVGFGIMILLATVAAFHYNKEQFLLECLKYLAVFGGGGGIGYGIGLRRGHAKPDNQ